MLKNAELWIWIIKLLWVGIMWVLIRYALSWNCKAVQSAAITRLCCNFNSQYYLMLNWLPVCWTSAWTINLWHQIEIAFFTMAWNISIVSWISDLLLTVGTSLNNIIYLLLIKLLLNSGLCQLPGARVDNMVLFLWSGRGTPVGKSAIKKRVRLHSGHLSQHY